MPDRGAHSDRWVSERLLEVYRRLLAAYGPQGWWPGAQDPFEVIVGAILVQSVAWSNAEQALANLRSAGALSPEGLLRLPQAELAALIRPSGYYTVKARRLRAFVEMLAADFGGSVQALLGLPLAELRAKLLGTYGIGEETADDIVLYAAHQPIFVVDAYTIRLFTRLGLRPDDIASGKIPSGKLGSRSAPPAPVSPPPPQVYRAWQRLFMDHLPAHTAMFNEYHALIVRHGVVRCRKRDPRCGDCPLLDLCPAGQASLSGVTEAAGDGRAQLFRMDGGSSSISQRERVRVRAPAAPT